MKMVEEIHNKGPAFSQSLGRFHSGWGQARHSTISSPWDVPATPWGSWPQPAHLRDIKFLHILKTWWISSYRYCWHQNQGWDEQSIDLQWEWTSWHCRIVGEGCGSSRTDLFFLVEWVCGTFPGNRTWKPFEGVKALLETTACRVIEPNLTRVRHRIGSSQLRDDEGWRYQISQSSLGQPADKGRVPPNGWVDSEGQGFGESSWWKMTHSTSA